MTIRPRLLMKPTFPFRSKGNRLERELRGLAHIMGAETIVQGTAASPVNSIAATERYAAVRIITYRAASKARR